MTAATRKPRIALMGEFSSGKSTLSNLMLGARPLPEKVTATRLSPVWMSHGIQPAYRVDVDGSEEPVDINDLETVDVEATRVIRLFFEADILEVCDLIDFPGISDPNMSSEVWQRMMGEVDAVLWCTHATQAWRQSEAAVWETVPEAVKQRSVLLVTKFDKLISERDRYRVLARLGKETDGQFGALFPISLTKALAAGDDFEAFNASGGGAFLEHLIGLIEELNADVGETTKSIYETAMGQGAGVAMSAEDDVPSSEIEAVSVAAIAGAPENTEVVHEHSEVAAISSSDPVIPVETNQPIENVESAMPIEDQPSAGDVAPRIVPKRVRPTGVTQSVRPRRPAATPKVALVDPDFDTPEPRRVAQPNANHLRSIFAVDEDGAEDVSQAG